MAPYHILLVIISSVKSAAPNLHISAPLLKRFSCFSRKRTDLPKKELHGVCTLTKVYQYAKVENLGHLYICTFVHFTSARVAHMYFFIFIYLLVSTMTSSSDKLDCLCGRFGDQEMLLGTNFNGKSMLLDKIEAIWTSSFKIKGKNGQRLSLRLTDQFA